MTFAIPRCYSTLMGCLGVVHTIGVGTQLLLCFQFLRVFQQRELQQGEFMDVTELVPLTGCGRNFDLGYTDLMSFKGIKLPDY